MLQFALARGIGEVSIKKAIAFIESNNLSWDDFIQDRNLLYHFGLKDNVITNISTTKSQAYALYEELELSGVKILSESDIAYPQYLKNNAYANNIYYQNFLHNTTKEMKKLEKKLNK